MSNCPDPDDSLRARVGKSIIDWIDCHPRIGWYIVVLTTLDVLLNALELFR